MLTLQQIVALIALLVSFGVDQPTINQVQEILLQKQQIVKEEVAVEAKQPIVQELLVAGDIPSDTEIDETTLMVDSVQELIIKINNQINDASVRLNKAKKEVQINKLCDGTKTANGCESSLTVSKNVSTYGSVLAQLIDRKERLIKLSIALQNGGIGALTDTDIKFINSLK